MTGVCVCLITCGDLQIRENQRTEQASVCTALDAPVEFDALPEDCHFTFAPLYLVPEATTGVIGRPERNGFMTTRCKTARMAVRFRSVLHNSHASRTCSDGECHLARCQFR